MRAFQDDFSEQVAAGYGMARIGPARRRLTRAAWKAEQEQARIYERSIKHWRKEAEAATDAGLLAYLSPDELNELCSRRARESARIQLALKEPVKPVLEEKKPMREEEKWAQTDPIIKAFLDGTLGKKGGPEFSR